MQLLIVRGSGGVTTWTKQPIGAHTWQWVCSRDQFAVNGPDDPSQAESAALSIAQHSVGLVGAILQLVQVDL